MGEGEGEEAYPTMCTWMLVSGHGVIQLTGFPLVRGTREEAYPTLCTWMFVSGRGGIQLTGFPLVGGEGRERLRPRIYERG